MEAVIEKNGTTVTVAPEGRLDTVTSAALKEQLACCDTAGLDFVFDFEKVDYTSSAGLRLLAAVQKKTRAEGHSMSIKNINPVVREVFRVSGFNKAFTVL